MTPPQQAARMRAVRWLADAPQLVQLGRPTPAAGEVLVRPTLVGICGTDLHAATLPDLFRQGVVLGHEFVGLVESDVRGEWAPGTHVVVNPNGAICGRCRQCRTGQTNLCPVATRERCVGVQCDGGLSDLVAVPSRSLHEVPDMADEVAVWTEPLAAAVRAVARCQEGTPSRVAVFGGGPVGLLAAQLLARADDGEVCVFEPRADRREVGRRLGLDVVAAPPGSETVQPSYDAALDCAGTASSLQAAVALVRQAGRLVVLGVPPQAVPVDVVRLVLNEIKIEGTMIYTESEFRTALELLQSGAVDPRPLTSAEISLEEFVVQYPRLRRGEGVGQKVLVRVSA